MDRAGKVRRKSIDFQESRRQKRPKIKYLNRCYRLLGISVVGAPENKELQVVDIRESQRRWRRREGGRAVSDPRFVFDTVLSIWALFHTWHNS